MYGGHGCSVSPSFLRRGLSGDVSVRCGWLLPATLEEGRPRPRAGTPAVLSGRGQRPSAWERPEPAPRGLLSVTPPDVSLPSRVSEKSLDLKRRELFNLCKVITPW